MIRFAHLSDIHVTAPKCRWQLRDFASRRVGGWLNHRVLGRKYRFRHAEQVLRTLKAEIVGRSIDHVIFSGDATALGFEEEFQNAVTLLGADGSTKGIAVPGNHDYPTGPAARSGAFEEHFAPWQQGIRVDDATYPFAQEVGGCWLIGVNSAHPSLWPWDATGRVGVAQTERLQRLLTELPDGPRILVTHYPLCLSNGYLERPWRRLRDLDLVLPVATVGNINLWLHGHRHHGYHILQQRLAQFPAICAGSTTQTGIWSYLEYEIEGTRCRATRRTFDVESKSFSDGEPFEVTLAVSSSQR